MYSLKQTGYPQCQTSKGSAPFLTLKFIELQSFHFSDWVILQDYMLHDMVDCMENLDHFPFYCGILLSRKRTLNPKIQNSSFPPTVWGTCHALSQPFHPLSLIYLMWGSLAWANFHPLSRTGNRPKRHLIKTFLLPFTCESPAHSHVYPSILTCLNLLLLHSPPSFYSTHLYW